MLEPGRELLHKAIRAGSIAVVTMKAPASGERLILRLLPAGSSTDARAITAAVEEGKGGLIDQLIESAAPVWVRIRICEWSALAFQTTIVSQQGRFLGRKVVLRQPQQVTVEQRRRAPRERVPQDVRVQARFSLQQRGGAAISADMWDLSETGICLWCRAADLPPTLQTDEPIELTLAYGGKEQALSARFRYRTPMENGGVRLGLQFDAPTNASPAGAATSDAIRALIEVLSQLRIRRESEKFVTRALGLAS